jgi:hypothetical protein
MDDFVSFDSRIVHLLNPLPQITVEELHKRAGLTMRKPKSAQRQVFDLELRWGGGVDLKTHTLQAGKSIRMPDRIGREIADDFKPVGGDICGTSPGLAIYTDEAERHQAMLQALLIAENHYHAVGAGQIDGVRNARGHDDNEVEKRYRNSTYSSYFLAMAKEEVIRERRLELQERGPKKG